jgi:hypothetical protein
VSCPPLCATWQLEGAKGCTCPAHPWPAPTPADFQVCAGCCQHCHGSSICTLSGVCRECHCAFCNTVQDARHANKYYLPLIACTDRWSDYLGVCKYLQFRIQCIGLAAGCFCCRASICRFSIVGVPFLFLPANDSLLCSHRLGLHARCFLWPSGRALSGRL